jgi:HAD superfamily hydrolase (TIGR01509 family)
MPPPAPAPEPATLEAVVLDVDGTLVDSERDGHRVAFNRAFEEAGLSDRWDVERYGELLAVTGGKRRLNAYFEDRGMPADEREELAARLHRRKTEIFTEMAKGGEIEARPGTAELLEELERAGVRLAVATTGSREWVDPLLDRLFGPERFEVIVGGDEVPERKPDPSAHAMTLERLGLPAVAAPGIEDSEVGLRAAKAAGLPCVIVVNDYTREQDFNDADLVLDGFGHPEERVATLADPHGLEPPGRLDVETLRGVVAAAGGV